MGDWEYTDANGSTWDYGMRALYGKTDTDLILLRDSTSAAAKACRSYNCGYSEYSQKWYLPSIGELLYVYTNIADINTKLTSYCYDTTWEEYCPRLSFNYWSSNQSSNVSGKYAAVYMNMDNGSPKNAVKTNTMSVRPFLAVWEL